MKTRRPLRETPKRRFALGAVLALLCASAPPPASAADRPERVQVGDYQLSGPYTHENLTIYLIHGKTKLTGKTPLTLQEALDQQKVVIRETGRVNELAIENVSSEAEVYVQSGDVIKGGRQDRMLASDLLLPPKSGKIPVATYCVEQGRWQQRGSEAKHHFSGSSVQLASKGLRLAGGQFGQFGQLGGMQFGGGGLQFGQFGGGQIGQFGGLNFGGGLQFGGGMQFGGMQFGGGGLQFGGGQFGPLCQAVGSSRPPYEVMRVVVLSTLPAVPLAGPSHPVCLPCAVLDELVRAGLVSSPGIAAPAGQGVVWEEVEALQRKLRAAVGASVRAKESESSLQLTLEDKRVQEAAEKYTRKLSAIVDDDEDAIGFLFAVNGKVDGGEVYASKDLFKKLWPKLLRAAAVEALAEWSKDEKYEPTPVDPIKACLLDSEKGDAQEKEVANRFKVLMRETDKYLLFEARDGDRWIHRSYLTK
jgi:hypothetical protein